MSTELNETERQELERLREAFKVRTINRSESYAINLASFVWNNSPDGPFEGDKLKLWHALPSVTQQQLIEFVEMPKTGPKLSSKKGLQPES